MSGTKPKIKTRVYTYNPAWEKESWAKGWLAKNKDQNAVQQAYCKVCRKSLRAHHTDLQAHNTRDSHTKYMNVVDTKNQQTLDLACKTQKDKQNEKKERDLKLSVYVACHSAIRSVNHLSDILSTELKGLQLHKTKCSNLIKNVVAPNMLKDLIEDIGSGPYSLIIDESTDVSTLKFLCLCVKYFSKIKNKVITDYLGIIQVEKADSDSLYKAILDYCAKINLKIKNMVGLGTDGGSNLCGNKHSVFTLLKANNSNLHLVRCICHCLDNAVSDAASHFPANIEFLCREIYNWFARSSSRQLQYKNTWNLLNSGVDEEAASNSENNACKQTEGLKFKKFVKLAKTRWLARYNVIKVILENYSTLQNHFNLFVKTNTEKCYTTRLLHSMLNDDTNYLYLLIIKPILGEVNYVNAAFQSNNVDLGRAFDDLSDFIMLLMRKILKPQFMSENVESVLDNFKNPSAFIPIESADYGIDYKNAVSKIKISSEQRAEIENRAFSFIKALCAEISDRLPSNLRFYKKLKFLSPSTCLSQTIRPAFSDLPFLEQFVSADKMSAMENQWNKLLTVDWAGNYGKDIFENSYTFWPAVYTFKNAGGKLIFEELATYALTLLCLPSSNAVVERVFSVMNVIKTKLRNKMLIKMLDALLRIRLRFYSNRTCCQTFIPTPQMMADFNYKIVYPESLSEKESVLQEEFEFEIIDLLESYEFPCITIENMY